MKQKTGRKLLGVLLTLAMVVGLMPGMSLTAKAADTEYQIWIGGTQVTSANAGNVFAGDSTNDGKVQFTPADGATPATLTLNSYSYEGDGGELNNQFFGILNKDADMPLNIKLQGENSVKLTGTGASYAIYSASDVTIEGNGSLDVSATGEKDYAIYGAKDLTVAGGTINVEGGQYGIAVNGNFKTDGETVNIKTKAVGTQGVGINGITSVVLNAGSVTAEGKYAGIISPNGTVNVSGGKIEASAESGGVVGTTVHLNGGEIIAEGTAGFGVYAMDDNGLVSVGEQVTSLTATGTLSAVYGKVTNAVPGTGWTNQEGTAGRKKIAVSAEGRSMASYKKIHFPPDHVHNFTYAAQGNTITATCDNENQKCNLNGNKSALTIVAPALATYGKANSAAATLSGLENFNTETELNVSADSIKYYNATKSGDTYNKNGAALNSAPTDAGDYVAEITLTGVNTDQSGITSVSAVVGYTIKAPTRIAITISSAEHGSVTASVNGSDVTSAEEGVAVTLTANPESGYYLESISGTYKDNSESLSGGGKNTTLNGTYFTVQSGPEGNSYNLWYLRTNSGVKVTSKGDVKITKVVFPSVRQLKGVVSDTGTVSTADGKITVDCGNGVNSVYVYGTGNNNAGSTNVYSSVIIYGNSAFDKALQPSKTGDPNVYKFTMPVVYQGDVSITPVFDRATTVTGISLSKTEAALTVGESVTLNANVTETDATYKTVTWKSDNEEVATVNNGVVNAVGGGTATITATADNGTPETTDDKIATCTVKVHAHNFVYSVTDNTIVRKCTAEECPLSVNPASLTITGSNTGAELTGDTSAISPLPEVKYYHVNDNDTKSYPLVPITTAPKEVGRYWAEFTLGDKTAHIVYEVVPAVSVGDKGYSTLQEAINHVNDGDTIKLLSDIKEHITFNKSGVTATLDLNGHTIDGDQKGTVLTIKTGTFILDDTSEGKTGVITGGYTAGNGGGVSVNGGTFTLKNGTIEGNKAGNGGGVSYSDGTFNMLGGTIQYNEGSGNTGGILVMKDAFTMSGGTIQYNVGANFGGIGATTNLNFSGTAVVKGNVIKNPTSGMITKTDSGYALAEGGTPCDVKQTAANLKINVVGQLASGAKIGVFNAYGANAFTTGYNTYNESSEASAFFFSNDSNKTIKKNDDGELIFADFDVEDVIAMICALPEASDVTTSDKDDIEAARKAYDSLSDDLKANVTNYEKLTAAEAALDQALFTAYKTEQKNAADGKAQEGDSDEATALIAAAKKAIDELTYDTSKELSENKAAVDAVITKLGTDLADQRAADLVITAINALPSSNEVTTANKDAIEAAREAFDALTDAQKAKVGETVRSKLESVETALKKIDLGNAIDEAEAYYNSIKESNPEPAATLLEAINAAKAVKENADTTQTDVDNALSAIAAAKTTAEQAVLAETKTKLGNAIDEAEAYYNSIKESNPEAAATLLQAINAAKAVKDNGDATQADVENAAKALAGAKTVAETVAAINALPDFSNVTADNKASVEAARAAYDALTPEQQNGVSADTLKKLTDSEDKLVILQTMSEVSAKTGSDAVYNGGNPIQLINTPTTALPEGYKMVYTVTTENKAPSDESLYTTSIPTETNAGTYYVWYRVKGDSNHNDVAAASVTVTINKKLLTITAGAKSKVYGEKDPELTYDSTGLVEGDNITGSLTRDAGENAGTYAITQGTVTASDNYELSYVPALLTITKADSNTTAPTANELNYSGSAQELVTAGTPTGGTLVYSTDGESYNEMIPTGINAGEYTVYYKVIGDANHNDKVVQQVTVTILARTLDIKADEKSKTYGEDDPALTYTSEGLVEGDSITGALSRAEGENVGTYAIEQGTLTAGDNYIITYTGANLAITEAASSVTTEPVTKMPTYNGGKQTLVAGGEVAGGTMQYALGTDAEIAPTEGWSTSIPAETDAGTYYVWYRAVGDNNHSDVEATCVSVDIEKAAITITADDKSSQKGAELQELSWQVSGDYVSGDELGISASTTADSSADAGVYPITVSWNDNANYEATLISGKYTITAPEESGRVETKTIVADNVPSCSISNLTTELARSLATEEELIRVQNGENLLIYLDMENIDDSVSATDKSLVEAAVKASSKDAKVGMYLDLTLYKKVGDGAATKVTDTKESRISVTIEVPDSLKGGSDVTRTFYIIRVHDGATDILATTTETTITFETDKFSTYALAYSDKSNGSPSVTTPAQQEKAPKTGDNFPSVWLWALILAGGLVPVGYAGGRHKGLERK